MRVLVIGKYPPIQGGTAAKTWMICRWLAERGHEIHVITNAQEVEDDYREVAVGDDDFAAPFVAPSGGSVALHSTTADHPSDGYFIPATNPYLSKLIALASSVGRARHIDAVFGIYLEPFGVAAWTVGRMLGVPVAQMHAGSDIQRLAARSAASTLYWDVMRDADLVVTSPAAHPILLKHGIDPERTLVGIPSHSTPDRFRPDGPTLSIADIVDAGRQVGLTSPWPGDPGDDRPIIGYVGKMGRFKGIRALLEVGNRVRSEGRLVFLSGCGERSVGVLRAEADEEQLDGGLVTLLPFIPPWRMPDFLRTCAVLCCLENQFPVSIHRPHTPREAILCGTPLVVSAELVRNQPTLLEGKLVHVVEDPNDSEELESAVRQMLHRSRSSDRLVGEVPAERPSRWTEAFVSRLAAAVQEREARRMTAQGVQSLMVRLYTDRLARSDLDRTIERELERGQIDRSEANSILEAWTELAPLVSSFALELLEKRFRYLWGQFQATSSLLEANRNAARHAFLTSWTLSDLPALEEFDRFATLILRPAGIEVLGVDDCVRFDLARLQIRFAPVVVPVNEAGWHVAPDATVLALDHAVESFLADGSSLGPASPNWLGIAAGARAGAFVYTRLNEATAGLILACTGAARSLEDLAKVLGISSERERGQLDAALSQLLARGLLVHLGSTH